MRLQADVIEGVARRLGLASVALLTHDMGDTVGGELLARDLAGTLPFDVTRRVITNGSIYIDMAQLTDGQHFLLALDDAPTDLVTAEGFKAGLAGTFSPKSKVGAGELDAQWLFASRRGGNRMLRAHDPLHRGPPGRGAALHRCDRNSSVASVDRVG